jgi:plastocyanin
MAAALVAVSGSLGLVACGNGDDVPPAIGGDLIANRFLRFEPDEFSVRLDSQVSFVFENRDSREHNFSLPYVFVDEFTQLSVDVAGGESAEVRFTVRERPPKGVEFLSFYCRFHQSEGMQGKIRVL